MAALRPITTASARPRAAQPGCQVKPSLQVPLKSLEDFLRTPNCGAEPPPKRGGPGAPHRSNELPELPSSVHTGLHPVLQPARHPFDSARAMQSIQCSQHSPTHTGQEDSIALQRPEAARREPGQGTGGHLQPGCSGAGGSPNLSGSPKRPRHPGFCRKHLRPTRMHWLTVSQSRASDSDSLEPPARLSSNWRTFAAPIPTADETSTPTPCPGSEPYMMPDCLPAPLLRSTAARIPRLKRSQADDDAALRSE